jgi:hypothetical protein
MVGNMNFQDEIIKERIPDSLNFVRTDLFLKILNKFDHKVVDQFVDIGASNGIDYDPTHCLNAQKWSGLSFELSREKFAELSRNLNQRAIPINLKVTPSNIIEYMKNANIDKNFGALSIDIDGYDFFIIKSILENGFRPEMICVECNTIFPPGIIWTVLYKENYFWEGSTHFLGCSISTYDRLMKKFGYTIVCYDWENAYYVKNENASKFIDEPELAGINRFWITGYFLRPDRGVPGGFEWNSDFEPILDKIDDPEFQVLYTKRHPHFRSKIENEDYVCYHEAFEKDVPQNVLDLVWK